MSKRPRKVAFSDEVEVEDKRRRDEEDENEKEGERSECALYRNINITLVLDGMCYVSN